MIALNNVGVEFSAKPLFTGVSAVINPGEKIALTGKNGAGKSTLLKIIAGEQTPTIGSVSSVRDVTIGYLPQQLAVSDSVSVLEETRRALADVPALREQLVYAEKRIEEAGDDLDQQIERAEILRERLHLVETGAADGEIERTLFGLGFEREEMNRLTAELSGGWRMRIELAKILLQRPDILLLDEPTNHLDIESIRWLEGFLKRNRSALVLVSHDKTFVDRICNRTWEISCGRMTDYRVGYTQYLTLRAERLEQQRRAYENQRKQIAEIKEFIERFRYKPTKSNQVQSRIKMLEKIVPIEIDEVDNSRLHLKFPPAPRSGDYPVIIDGVGKCYGEHRVFSKADIILRRGEKVAFVGRNGQGKTTLVKCILGQIDYEGSIRLGHNVKVGYFAQNQAQLLDGDITVFDTIDSVATGDIRLRIRDLLGAFMFGGEAADKYVCVLSGGEKTRLAMIRLLLKPVNLLILDEPTNHLDLSSKQVLKQAVKSFEGSAIIVSHDRDFLDGLVDKVYEFKGGTVRENLGGIAGFLAQEPDGNPDSLKVDKTTKNVPSNITQLSGGAEAYHQRKEDAKRVRKARKELEACEAEIEQLETDKATLEAKLTEGDASSDILTAYATLTDAMQRAMDRWEKATMVLEELENK